MSEQMFTRAFHEDDYDAVLKLWQSADGVEVAEGDDRQTIDAYLKRNPKLSRVSMIDGRIVGAVLCSHDGRRGLIYHLAVEGTQRGKGIGRTLVEECVAGLRAAGIRRALILVEKENRYGREFWRSRGFEEISTAVPFGVDIA